MAPHIAAARRRGAALVAFTMASAVLLMVGNSASAAIVATVPLGTAANYAVLGHSTVTNTGNTVLNGSLGLWSGTSVTGFPPGTVVPPGTKNITNTAAHQAQNDLTAAYINAAGRPVTATTTADLANKHLGAGVYSGPSKSPLSLTGPLVLDGAGDLSSVFIFQTDSTLITASGSTVALVNGAQACNVFWQVGSSATLGSGSVFAGNILALASVTLNSSVTVWGRALARTGAVTMIDDNFKKPTCAQSGGGGGGGTTTTTAPGGGGTATTQPGGGTATTIAPGVPGTPGSGGGSGPPGVTGPPRTGGGPLSSGSFPWPAVVFASLLGAGMIGAVLRGGVHSRGAVANGARSPRRR
jgi:hypothetical protein